MYYLEIFPASHSLHEILQILVASPKYESVLISVNSESVRIPLLTRYKAASKSMCSDLTIPTAE